jgi:dipeptidyl aminopeptidase/acylaminoacyl peptidase
MRTTLRSALLVSLVALVTPGAADAQGGTDIWVVELRGSGSALELGRPRNLTARAGYDNQPQFTPDGAAVLYTRIEDSGRSDVWRVALAGGAPTRVTSTEVEQEYSPTPMPDGSGFSAIVVEKDSTQRLWSYDWNGVPQRPIVPALKPVGYHVWVGSGSIGAFVLSQPTPRDANALVLMQPLTGRVDTLARGIARAFARVPGREAFTFVHQHGDTAVLGEVDVRTRRVRRITPLPDGLEYHVWLPDGTALIAGNGTIWRWADARLTPFVDLRAFGIEGVSRLALSPDGKTLAFVAADPK